MADDLLALMDQVVTAWVAVDEAHERAQAAGQVERAVSLELVRLAVADGVLALDELLTVEGTPYRPPPGGGPKGGRRLRTVA